MAEHVKEVDPEKLALLYERFRDVCLVEKEVWTEIYLPRDVKQGPILTNVQVRYDVEIDDVHVTDVLEANIPMGRAALGAAIEQYRSHIGFYRKG
ncbi:MAG: hypothetical protein NW703_14385 [Nitrospiraceae bacterium]